MSGKIYTLITFVTLFWFFCLYVGFRNQKKIITPVEFFIFSRQLPSWAYFALITSVVFSGLIFFFQPSLIFFNGIMNYFSNSKAFFSNKCTISEIIFLLDIFLFCTP